MQNCQYEPAIILPAALFSIVHVVPFHKAPKGFLSTILFSAFVLGVLAGYYRAISGSLIPAIMIHATFNGVGFLFKHISS